MDPRSEHNLINVHPDLCKVLRHAAQGPVPFIVSYGERTAAEEAKAVASGHSKTTHSRHVRSQNRNGMVCAVDTMAIIHGKLSFAPGAEKAVFGQIAKQIMASAAELGVHVQWGGADVGAWVPGQVSHFHDWGHFQLPWQEYP